MAAMPNAQPPKPSSDTPEAKADPRQESTDTKRQKFDAAIARFVENDRELLAELAKR